MKTNPYAGFCVDLWHRAEASPSIAKVIYSVKPEKTLKALLNIFQIQPLSRIHKNSGSQINLVSESFVCVGVHSLIRLSNTLLNCINMTV